MEDSVVILQGFKTRNSTGPSNPFTGHIPKGLYNILLQTHMHMYVYCSTTYYRKDLEPIPMPINDRLDKKNVAHIHHGILCSHKKNELLSFEETWMKLETIILSKRTQEQTPHVVTHKWELSNENTWTQIGNNTYRGLLGSRG